MACDAGGVSIISQDSRSFVSPAEHVGKHSDGVAGWRAWGGSAGIAGDKLGDPLAQPVSSDSSSASISASGIGFFRSIIGNLRLRSGSALFFGSRRLNRM